VLVTETFMQAVSNDASWPLVFPDPEGTVERVWSGSSQAVRCRVYRTVRAKDLWHRLCDSAYDSAEPGVLFIDRINGENNLAYCENLSAKNPCAETPLPEYGSCMLASLNLPAFVHHPFASTARLNEGDLRETTQIAIRFLDDAIDLSKYPLTEQLAEARRTRRVGLGITGLA